MFLKLFPYLYFAITTLVGIMAYLLLNRFTKITKDKIVGITTALASIPGCVAVLIIVFKTTSNPSWPWVIIPAVPVISYFFVPIWYRWAILPQLKHIEEAKKNKK